MTRPVVRASDARRTETPNAVMTTLASPSQGRTNELSMWLVEMRDGQQGPLHVFDVEQIWHVLSGEIEVTMDGKPLQLGVGDTVVIPAGVERRIRAHSLVRLVVCGRGHGIAAVPGETTSRGVPPWAS
jgi:quercetin dioxygenase-like cupin family protein